MFADGATQHRFSLYDSEHGVAWPESMMLVVLEATKFASASGLMRLWLQFFAAMTEEQVMSQAFASTPLQEAAAFVQHMNMTKEERALVDAYERDAIDRMLLRGAAFEEGEAKGRAEGEARIRTFAVNMLKKNYSVDQIAEITGFSTSEVERLAAEYALP